MHVVAQCSAALRVILGVSVLVEAQSVARTALMPRATTNNTTGSLRDITANGIAAFYDFDSRDEEQSSLFTDELPTSGLPQHIATINALHEDWSARLAYFYSASCSILTGNTSQATDVTRRSIYDTNVDIKPRTTTSSNNIGTSTSCIQGNNNSNSTNATTSDTDLATSINVADSLQRDLDEMRASVNTIMSQPRSTRAAQIFWERAARLLGLAIRDYMRASRETVLLVVPSQVKIQLVAHERALPFTDMASSDTNPSKSIVCKSATNCTVALETDSTLKNVRTASIDLFRRLGLEPKVQTRRETVGKDIENIFSFDDKNDDTQRYVDDVYILLENAGEIYRQYANALVNVIANSTQNRFLTNYYKAEYIKLMRQVALYSGYVEQLVNGS